MSSIDDWQAMDFRVGPSSDRPRPADPWREPLQPAAPSGDRAGQASDFWDWAPARPVAIRLPPVAPALEDALESIPFDPHARQQPWQTELAHGGRAASQARQKAATLVTLLEFSRPRDRAAALASLAELFEEFDHSATYQALLDQTRTGVDFETLLAMGDLKRFWFVTPAWWSRRRYCPLRRQPEFIRDRAGAAALTWRLARRICETRWRWPVELMIPEAWFSEWLRLPFHLHHRWSFAQFIEWRLDRDPDDDCDFDPPEPSPDGPQPGPLAWREVAASATSHANLLATRPEPVPDQLQ